MMRVVSLVPSVTETLLALGIAPVACTRFCEQPGIPTVGGTKDPDVTAITSLAPDLVVVCDEENRFDDAVALLDAGVRVHSMSPRSVEDVGPAVSALAEAVGATAPEPFATGWEEWLAGNLTERWYDAFVPIWRRPWMTLSGDTYGSTLLDLLGVANVFAGEPERYPTVTLDEVGARAPNLVVLPSEPYPFGERHVPLVRDALGSVPVVLVDGRDLFWFGARTPAAADRLRATLAAAR